MKKNFDMNFDRNEQPYSFINSLKIINNKEYLHFKYDCSL